MRRGNPLSVRTSHTGAEMTDAPLERREGGNRKSEATRGKAKRRTMKIKMKHGTVWKQGGKKS